MKLLMENWRMFLLLFCVFMVDSLSKKVQKRTFLSPKEPFPERYKRLFGRFGRGRIG